MCFRLGAMPTDPTFNPEETGWNRVKRGSSFRSLWIYGFLLSLITVPLMNLFWLLAGIDFIFPVHPSWSNGLLILPTILIHEMIHAVFYLDLGLSEKTVIGFWPSKMIAYAYHTAPISRNRLMLVGIAPLLFLSFLPILLFIASGGANFWSKTAATLLFQVSTLNVLLSGGDIFGLTNQWCYFID